MGEVDGGGMGRVGVEGGGWGIVVEVDLVHVP